MSDAALVRLDPDWELWALENLMAGAPRREVISALVEEGVGQELAEPAVEALLGRDLVRRTRRRLVRGRRSEQSLRLSHRLRGRLSIDDVDDEAPDAFFDRRWQGARAVRFLSAFQSMRANAEWSLRRVADELGSTEVEVNTRREAADGPSAIERHAETVPLGAFIDDCLEGGGNDRYIVSRNGLLQRPELKPLVDDIDPLPAVLDGSRLPRGASLWIGPAGTFTHPHFDPHHAFLVMLEGRKRIRLASPDLPVLFDGMDGYFARRSLADPAWDDVAGFDREGVAEVVLEPGQGLFIPVGTWHEVEALDASMMLSLLCFPWDNDYHWLRP